MSDLPSSAGEWRGTQGHLRVFAPLTAVEGAPASLRGEAAPLLEKERDACVGALIPKFPDPSRVDRAMPGPALTACDDPVNVREVQFRQRPNQWLAREESHFRGSLAQAVDAVQHPLVLEA